MNLTQEEKDALIDVIYDAIREDTEYAHYYEPPDWPPRTEALKSALAKLKEVSQ